MPRDPLAPARQPSLREHNLALVLHRVADAGTISRARIASATGLTKATVSSLVDSLLAGGLLRDLGPNATGVGRPGSDLVLGSVPVGIGVEINVDYLATCTVDLAGGVRRRELVAGDFRRTRVETTLARAAVGVRAAVEDARSAGGEVAGIYVAVPGLVDARRGVLRLAPNLGWRDVEVTRELGRRIRTAGREIPVRLDNEANLAALGELWCGEHRGRTRAALEDFLYVSGEIGIGAAIVLEGAVFRGVRGFAGEIGHVPMDAAGGVACRCGSRGCLELFAGQEAILRGAGLVGEASTSAGRPEGPIEELVTRAEAGDGPALGAISAAGVALGVAIATAVNLVDIDTVMVGGLYARLAPWLKGPIEAELSRRVLSFDGDPTRLLVGSLGTHAAVRGAAVHAVRDVIDAPAAWIGDVGVKRPQALGAR